MEKSINGEGLRDENMMERDGLVGVGKERGRNKRDILIKKPLWGYEETWC